MASTSETGHAKNVANLEELISFCTAYGTTYNPSKNNIKLTALNTLFTSAKNTLQSVKSSKVSFDNGTNTREIAFEPLRKLATRIINALEATDAKQQTIDDARTINRKIQGTRSGSKKPVPATESTPASTQISVSQQSYDNLIDSFAKLIQLVTAEPLYTPNESDLKVTALNTLLTTLKTANTAVINTTTSYSNSRISRDTTLYGSDTGLVDTALEVKKYIKSVYGSTSPQYKQVSKLQFRNR